VWPSWGQCNGFLWTKHFLNTAQCLTGFGFAEISGKKTESSIEMTQDLLYRCSLVLWLPQNFVFHGMNQAETRRHLYIVLLYFQIVVIYLLQGVSLPVYHISKIVSVRNLELKVLILHWSYFRPLISYSDFQVIWVKSTTLLTIWIYLYVLWYTYYNCSEYPPRFSMDSLAGSKREFTICRIISNCHL
jgi:hypothetical protein